MVVQALLNIQAVGIKPAAMDRVFNLLSIASGFIPDD
jgi:hypothetical protein